jgi:hypothetical protein
MLAVGSERVKERCKRPKCTDDDKDPPNNPVWKGSFAFRRKHQAGFTTPGLRYQKGSRIETQEIIIRAPSWLISSI